MSKTFHPSETGNLEPIKKRSKELAEAAKKLSASAIPAEFKKPEVMEAIKKLAADSKKLDELIRKKGKDEDITSSLSALHDVFHTIVEKCSPDDGHGHGHEGHGHEGHDHK
jgi:hypothetical protein